MTTRRNLREQEREETVRRKQQASENFRQMTRTYALTALSGVIFPLLILVWLCIQLTPLGDALSEDIPEIGYLSLSVIALSLALWGRMINAIWLVSLVLTAVAAVTCGVGSVLRMIDSQAEARGTILLFTVGFIAWIMVIINTVIHLIVIVAAHRIRLLKTKKGFVENTQIDPVVSFFGGIIGPGVMLGLYALIFATPAPVFYGLGSSLIGGVLLLAATLVALGLALWSLSKNTGDIFIVSLVFLAAACTGGGVVLSIFGGSTLYSASGILLRSGQVVWLGAMAVTLGLIIFRVFYVPRQKKQQADDASEEPQEAAASPDTEERT